jgi:hypothetical protein
VAEQAAEGQQEEQRKEQQVATRDHKNRGRNEESNQRKSHLITLLWWITRSIQGWSKQNVSHCHSTANVRSASRD